MTNDCAARDLARDLLLHTLYQFPNVARERKTICVRFERALAFTPPIVAV